MATQTVIDYDQDFIGPILTQRTDDGGARTDDVAVGEWLNMWADGFTAGVRREDDFRAVETAQLQWTVGSSDYRADQAFVPALADPADNFIFPVRMGTPYVVNLSRPSGVSGVRIFRLWVVVKWDNVDGATTADRRAPAMLLRHNTTNNVQPDAPEGFTAPRTGYRGALLLHEWRVPATGSANHIDHRVRARNTDMGG